MPKYQAAMHQAAMHQSAALAGMEQDCDDEMILLGAANVMEAAIEEWRLSLVRRVRLRPEPVPWAEIGAAIGFTKQAAMARYSKMIPPF